MDNSVLETLIHGRIEPHIYAFRTVKVPHYTKVGDTYRQTSVRVGEWERIIGGDVETIYDQPAFADEAGEVYFRDYSVHEYLEQELKKYRLRPTDPEGNPWFSNEFFLETDEEDIGEAVADIKESYAKGNPRHDYAFYMTLDKSRKTVIERKNLDYPMRDMQREVVRLFSERYNNTKSKLNLLIYAVMRFGKSFTVLQCALAMKAKLVIILSAKTDVKDSWNSTLYEHRDFNDYIFIDSKTLEERGFNLKKEIADGKKYVLFLSLQDLSGKDVKKKHQQLFKLNEPKTMLVVDETHFGARAAEYGQVLRDEQGDNKVRSEDLADTFTAEKLDVVKNFENVQVRIHLSGTPYRILMNGEFADNDIIAFVQYSDIVRAKKKWDEDNFNADDKEPEWANPYYGFPEMVRFAFNPNEESIYLINQMRQSGFGGLSELFAPVTTEKSDTPTFRHQAEVVGLLKSIDGTKHDKNIFPFLDYDKIRSGKMCRHMVWVLPFQASCDAMEAILKSDDSGLARLRAYSENNTDGYEIINISGYNCQGKYNTPKKVRSEIERLEKLNIKSITLTVQRMLTGSTVPEWDTMLFLKDTSSPQEYDQATFRIQNPYIKSFVAKDGRCIKIDMKPQTLLVDFDPARMFRMQEARSEFYHGNNANGVNDLEQRIQEDLNISPIIHISNDKMSRVEPRSIIDAVREYSKTRSVLDEASLIPADCVLLTDEKFLEIIGALEAFDNKKGLEINPFEGDGMSLGDLDKLLGKIKSAKKTSDNKDDKGNGAESELEILRKKQKTFYAQILLFAFLSDSKIKYLDDIIRVLEERTPDDVRIADHIGINVNVLKLVRDKASQRVRQSLDEKILNVHDLMQNSNDTKLQKAKTALTKFDRLSTAEIVTPQEIIDAMIDGLPADAVTDDTVFLDLASKQGELTVSFWEKHSNVAKENLFSVATSAVAYEMTRKVYKSMGIPEKNVLLPPQKTEDYYDKLRELVNGSLPSAPNVVLCCPPFQKPKGGGRGDGGADIYPCYFDLCKKLNPNAGDNVETPYLFGMFTKATWNTHSTQAEGLGYNADNDEGVGEVNIAAFRKMMLTDRHIMLLNDYLNAKPFYKKNQSVTLRGGVNVFLWNVLETDKPRVRLYFDKDRPILDERRPLLPVDLKELMIECNIVSASSPDFPYVRIGGKGHAILTKVMSKALSDNIPFLNVRPRNVFKIKGRIEKEYGGKPKPQGGIKTYVQKGNWLYVDKSSVGAYDTNRELVDSWKVVIAKGSSGEDTYPHSIISQPRIVERGSVCSDTYLVVKTFTTKQEADAFVGYAKSRFFRFMILLSKNDQNLTRHCYRFVPDIPEEKYGCVYDYYGISLEEQAFIDMFIREWDNDDHDGKCLQV